MQEQQEQGIKNRFIKKINIKQRQFNFSQNIADEPAIAGVVLSQETQLVLYEEPRKKLKINPIVERIQSIKNDVVSDFLIKLELATHQIKNSDQNSSSQTTRKQSRLMSKIESKQKQYAINVCRMTWSSNPHDYLPIPVKLDFEYQMDEMKRMNELSDSGVINLSKNLQRLDTPNLKLDLFKKWHTDTSVISDQAVENLSKGIYQMSNLTELQLGLHGWGYWNNNITNTALNHITTALSSLRQLNALKLDLNMWAYENEEITDKGTETLLSGISQLKDLGKLEINMKGWGDSNANITDESVNHLSKCLRKLGNLSEVKLVLWDKVSKNAIKKLNKSLAELDNLTSIDLKFETSSDVKQPTNPNCIARLGQIKANALRKRKLMFQAAAIHNSCEKLYRREKCWDITNKLLG